MSRVSNPVILICTTCRGYSAAAELRQVIAETAPEGAVFKPVDCLAGCDHKTAVGIQGAGKASYLFGPIETVDEARAIGAFAHQYEASESGWTSSQERPLALKDKTLARLPRLVSP